MEYLRSGQYYGNTDSVYEMDGIVLTDTVYTHAHVDWHYHENPYFTLILAGRLEEGSKKEKRKLVAGDLLFHNWQDPHYNIKPPGTTRGFHIELGEGWIQKPDIHLSNTAGSAQLEHPVAKLAAYQLLLETKQKDVTSGLAIETGLIQLLHHKKWESAQHYTLAPSWVSMVKDMIHAYPCDKLSLATLSECAQVHPVHLSRDFARYFGCSLSHYIRRLRIAKSLTLLGDAHETLAGIAVACGFFDQSHYTHYFKMIMGVNPASYRQSVFNFRPR